MSACLSPLWSAVFVMVLFLFMVCGLYHFFDDLLVLDYESYFIPWLAIPAPWSFYFFDVVCVLDYESYFIPWLAIPAPWSFYFFDVVCVLDYESYFVPWLDVPAPWIWLFRRVSRLGQ